MFKQDLILRDAEQLQHPLTLLKILQFCPSLSVLHFMALRS